MEQTDARFKLTASRPFGGGIGHGSGDRADPGNLQVV